MTRKTMHRHRIAFSDCDPAQIVHFSNYFKWFDTASFEFFVSCGVPPWRELALTRGIIGTPLVNASAKFINSATYGEDIDIETSIVEWRNKAFVMNHVARRGDTLIAEGEEIRVFAIHDPDNPLRVKAIPIPADIRAMCE
ncbi:MAG: acyl-CoA thioesterase [Rhodocyclaceae bacterium]|nr:acyl-CoA thioesterase [Rhodocyclaceae bacterium]